VFWGGVSQNSCGPGVPYGNCLFGPTPALEKGYDAVGAYFRKGTGGKTGKKGKMKHFVNDWNGGAGGGKWVFRGGGTGPQAHPRDVRKKKKESEKYAGPKIWRGGYTAALGAVGQ